ncbi:hypothetical protein [Olsenella massiliensis]|uniref:hypothetical protein n=1 Tax=Olsenella massiliensis TaxID=1622075 RepID=UPI0012E3BDDD|nr:hypothetical protein [Olsenella massiliensis]
MPGEQAELADEFEAQWGRGLAPADDRFDEDDVFAIWSMDDDREISISFRDQLPQPARG